MKVQFIGTGNIASTSNSASVLINNHILFDMPNGNLKAMLRQKIDILKIDTVIISHTHADHCFDMPFLLWYKENYKKEEQMETKIITDEITRQNIENLINMSYFNSAKRAKKEWIDFKLLLDTKISNEVTVTSEPMQHKGIIYANGYKIEENKVSIGVTGDTMICEGVKKLANQVDYLIADMTLEVGDDSHMGIDNILAILKENPNLKIIPVHMQDKTRKKAKELNLDNLIILEDGDILEI